MWQRFTERARGVIFFAQEEAQRLGVEEVGTAHLLLGLIRDNECVAARVLDYAGVSLGRVRSEVERQVKRVKKPPNPDMQLAPDGKTAINLAYEEVHRLGNNYVGTEHLLLGLVRDETGVAGSVFRRMNITHEILDAQLSAMKAKRDEQDKENLSA